jgi:hypothetical protein
LIEYPSPDHVAITDVGEAQSIPIELRTSLLCNQSTWTDLKGCILKAIATHYPSAVPNETAATEASYSATSSSYANPRSALEIKDLIGYPEKDHVSAADWLARYKQHSHPRRLQLGYERARETWLPLPLFRRAGLSIIEIPQ